jgi:hypothetical protein
MVDVSLDFHHTSGAGDVQPLGREGRAPGKRIHHVFFSEVFFDEPGK